MHGFFSGQVLIDFLGNKRSKRSDQLGKSYHYFIGRCINRLLVFVQFFRPESSSCSSDIPVGHIFDNEVLDLANGFHMVVLIHICRNFLDQLVVLGNDPAIQFRTFCIWYIQRSRIQIILIGIQREEVVYVPQSSKEFAYDLDESVFVELGRRPCRRSIQQVPSRSIRTILVKQCERVYCVAHVLTHLLAVFIQDQVVY